MQLSRLVLRVNSPQATADFYVARLGMVAQISGERALIGYQEQAFRLQLVPAASGGPYVQNKLDQYWKIGVTLPNVDIACAQLRAVGIDVSEPRQFLDIGYMCHFSDPDGFAVELLQQTFESNRPADAGNKDEALGGGANIGQVTLRTNDINGALKFYRDELGMKLLSIQPVNEYGFTLYFLGFTDNEPPDRDLKSVKNREWLWQRSYPTLELQHFHEVDTCIIRDDGFSTGYSHIVLKGAGESESLVDELGTTVLVE